MKMRMENKSSEELKQIIKNEGFFGSSSVEKAIAMKILKERGECQELLIQYNMLALKFRIYSPQAGAKKQ